MDQIGANPTIKAISDKSLPILKKYKVEKAGIFGSIVKDSSTEKSDIDMLVQVPRGTGLLKFISLKLELEKVLQKQVDLVSYTNIKPQIKEEVLASVQRIL